MIPSSTLLDVSDFFVVPHRILTSPVSIHAPTWGATYLLVVGGVHLKVSTHAPTWEATPVMELKSAIDGPFQPTLPHGKRPGVGVAQSKKQWFQSTLPHGERLTPLTALNQAPLFQSTLPHGERRTEQSRTWHIWGFNPRSHMGSDLCELEQRIIELVSIHAPAWGATGRRSLCRGHRSVLTHAPTRGATQKAGLSPSMMMFQPTLPHGERRQICSAG